MVVTATRYDHWAKDEKENQSNRYASRTEHTGLAKSNSDA